MVLVGTQLQQRGVAANRRGVIRAGTLGDKAVDVVRAGNSAQLGCIGFSDHLSQDTRTARQHTVETADLCRFTTLGDTGNAIFLKQAIKG